MSIKFDLRGFDGFDEALAELEQLSGKTTQGRAVLRRVGTKALEPVRLKMAALAPKESGELAGSIKTQQAKRKRRRGQMKYDRATDVTLLTGPAPARAKDRANAGWQEFGTVHQSPNSYARPAIDSEGPGVVQRVKEGLLPDIEKTKQRMLRKMAKKG